MNVGALEGLENQLAGRLAGRLARHVQAPNLPWAAQVVSWIDLVDLCRDLDETLVSSECPSEDVLLLHRAIVNLAIGCGGWLIHQVRAGSVDISASSQTLNTLDASLELLKILQATWHPNLPPGEVESTRRRVFDGSEFTQVWSAKS